MMAVSREKSVKQKAQIKQNQIQKGNARVRESERSVLEEELRLCCAEGRWLHGCCACKARRWQRDVEAPSFAVSY